MIKAWRQRRALADEGFTLVEVMVAMTILAVLSATFGLTMNATVRTYLGARNRTLAEQLATEQTEDARRLDYDDLGTFGGSPPGPILVTKDWVRDGRTFTVTTAIDYVDDPIPPPDGYQSYANYKRVHVVVRAAGTTKVLADLETLVAPPLQPDKDKAVVKVQVLDYGNNTFAQDATVQLTGGPSPIQSKITNAGGALVFAQLTPNATTGTINRYYDITVTKPGYEVLPENRPPAAVARPVLVARMVFASTISIYKAMRVALTLVNPIGEPYLGTASVAISAPPPRTSGTVSVTGGAADITAVGAESVIPSVVYTFTATTPEGTFSATKTVGSTNYPAVLTDSVTVQVGYQRTPLDVVVTDQRNGAKIVGATVQLTGGPQNLVTPRTAVTDSNGVARFNNTDVSPSRPYTITIPAFGGYGAATTTTTVAAANPAPVPMTLQRATTRLNVTVVDDTTSLPISAATVQVTGGPYAETLPAATTDAAGQAGFDVYIGGASYTVTVPATAGYNAAAQTVPVPGPGATAVTIRLQKPSTRLDIVVTDQRNGAKVVGATVQLSGGPLVTPRTAVTDSNGVARFDTTEVSALPYTITIPAFGGFGAATTTTTVAAANPPPVPVTLQRVTTRLNVTVVDDATSLPISATAVQVTGGPYAETLPAATTDAAGKAGFDVYTSGASYTVTVPATAGYSQVVQTVPVPGPGATAVTIRLPKPSTRLDIVVTDQRNGVYVVGATVQLTGGPLNLVTPRTAVTDSNGLARFDNTDVSASMPYTITIPAYGGYVAKTAATTVGAANPPPVPVTLQRGTTLLNVTVVDDRTSLPISAIAVQVTGGPYAETLPPVTTNAAGKAGFVVYTGGAAYTVTVPAGAGYSQLVVPVSVPGPGATDITIRRVRPKVTLEVTVTNIFGSPRSGRVVQVTAGPYNETPITLPPVTTGANGKATFLVAVHPTVTYTVTVAGPFGPTTRTILVTGPGTAFLTVST